MSAYSDEQLVLEALDDLHPAFGQLVKQHQHRILRTIMSIISDEQAAQDVAQETFLAAWSNLQKLKERQKFGRWLNQIAINLSKHWLRDQRLYKKHAASFEDMTSLAQDQKHYQERLRREVWEAIDELTEDHREAVTLYYISGYSYKEISEMLAVPVSTIRGRLEKARNQLRKEFLDMVTQLQLEIDSTVHKFLKEHAKQNGVSVEGLIIRLIERYKMDMDSPKMEIRRVDHPGLPSPDDRYLCFIHEHNLAIRDLSTGESRDITDEATDPSSSHGWRGVRGSYVWSSDSKQIAYGWWDKDHGELRIIMLDGSESRVLCRSQGSVYVFDWSHDGKSILARFDKPSSSKEIVREIALVSVADGSVQALDLPTQDRISLSPDGRYVVYSNRVKEHNGWINSIFLSATDGSGEEVPLAPGYPNDDDYAPIWAPDGKTVVFVSTRDSADSAGLANALFLRQVVDGRPVGEPQLVKREAGFITSVKSTRNGSLQYFTRIRQSDIYVASLDTGTGKILEPPKLMRSEGLNSRPVWSPDGNSLAYVSVRRFPGGTALRWFLVIRSMETGGEREFLAYMDKDFPAWHIGTPRWSPDGRSILFRCHFRGPKIRQEEGIHLINVQTGHVTTVLERRPGESLFGHAWSPDGKTIFYRRRIEGRGEWTCSIMKHDIETGQVEELYQTDDSFQSYLRVSPDGQQLAFSDGDERIIKLISTKGGESTELLSVRDGSDEVDEWVYPQAWTSEGRHLLFLKERWLPPDDSRGWQRLPSELWRIPAEGGEPRKLITEEELMPGASLWVSSFHPDGNRIAFIRSRSDQEHWIIDNLLSVFATDK